MQDVNVTPWDATSPSSSLPWPSRFRVCEGVCVSVCACARARALPGPSPGDTMETMRRRQPQPGGLSDPRWQPLCSGAALPGTSLRERAGARPRVGRDRPAVRLGWSRVGVLLARLRGCPEARSQGEGVKERTALPKEKAPPASFSE